MNLAVKPLLTIGMIVKNEIRCIERCLKSLQPLRAALPCELIIADTGSNDGTREVVERYADLVFDFEWVDDFAAARNAVLDRARGEWYFSIDADEWLDKDFSALTEFLKTRRLQDEFNVCGITFHNYTTDELDNGPYGCFLGTRLFRLSDGRYTGAIHEFPEVKPPHYYILSRLVLHHDGYVCLNREQGKAKRERNMILLREKLRENPQDLLVWQQCIESSMGTPDCFQYIQQAAEGVEQKWHNWQECGPTIFRYRVSLARTHQLPEFWEWVRCAQEYFPDALATRAEINALAFWVAVDEKKYAEAVQYGEGNLRAVADYRAGKYDPTALLAASITTLSSVEEINLRLKLADAYLELHEYTSALKTLTVMDAGQLNCQHAGALLGNLLNLQAQSHLDLTGVIVRFWDQLTTTNGDEKRKNQRVAAAVQAAAAAFLTEFRQGEVEKGVSRHAYTLLLPLNDRCDLGRAAALLHSNDTEEADLLLSAVKDFDTFPAGALMHGIELGASFPPEGRTLSMETLDGLAVRLAGERTDYLPELCVCMPLPEGNDGDENWARALLLAAVQTADWEHSGVGAALARRFAEFERSFLPRYYAPRLLEGEGLWLLPPLHRFGIALARAFDALDGGDPVSYIRLLREGLTLCESMRPMAEFLMKETQKTDDSSSEELAALAEQVRRLLASFPEGDPRLQQLRESPAYQQVAKLLE
ncbi:MAG: glycosyltransferase [Clostridiales bacterium]|nr:glycosyltransferase [Clostridiales bacterium]